MNKLSHFTLSGADVITLVISIITMTLYAPALVTLLPLGLLLLFEYQVPALDPDWNI